MYPPSHAREIIAETIGTFILVFFGTGAVHAAVLTGSQAGLWQVAIVWGFAIALAIYATGSISGAHINPAITLSMWAFRKFPSTKIPGYLLGQLVGAFLASAVLYLMFQGTIEAFEQAKGIVRASEDGIFSGMVYGMYFPNPGVQLSLGWDSSAVSWPQAMGAEFIGTAFLAFFVFSLTDPTNLGSSGSKLAPVFIGLTVAIIISVVAPITQAGLNPARDFGPRLFAFLAGWGEVAIPGPRGGFFSVYTVSPILGGLVGAGIYQMGVHPAHRSVAELDRSAKSGDL
jgi:glycerol uptake facilitator protein